MAVYTDVTDSELETYLLEYELGELTSLKGIAEGVENSNFLLTTDKGRFILTLYEKRVDPADLPFFLGLKQHLAERGINCPRPIPKRNGEFLGELAGRPAAIISYLDGVSVRKPGLDHCRQLGATMARIHDAGEGFNLTRKNALSLSDWRPLFEKSADRANEVADDLSEMISTELDFLERSWPSGMEAGIIHADLFPDNVFFLKQELSGIIDFYFACNDIYAYDIAVCINAWCFEPDWQFNVTKARAMLRAYNSVCRIPREEIEQMAILCRGAALRFLLTRLYDWLNVPPGALVIPKDPAEYIAKLRFHQKASGPAAYGLDDSAFDNAPLMRKSNSPAVV